ncbi:MAG: oxygen-independent coproporphyrinogen III oxidase [Rhodobacteraceae bacterium]|nr:oxygen-independent coproporphyrinogen III oxidase [Paracoccaceae bacterium]
MEHVNILREYGLFDAKVPRYTSYPPANRFEPNTGARMQEDWLADVPTNAPLSIYVHIPFCRRLCWFCACRTQGTRTLQPVDVYVDDLVSEIETVTSRMTGTHQMARLHLGGGTPTLLSVPQMDRLLDTLDHSFARAPDFEFSVEIDPTEAAPEILELLAARGMARASIGVQDFDPKVQKAIGRLQSYAQTENVISQLRDSGVTSLNVDLLYGLPYQTSSTLNETLQKVHLLKPDRLALYGYAHVPHMSKRQVMIQSDTLPSSFERYEASVIARRYLMSAGYDAIGIDHFALPSDSLAKAAKTGSIKRNFQGYTDDTCATLIGFGASAISKFRQGFVQNAVATNAYQTRLREGKLAGHKGYTMTPEDTVISALIDQIMCQARIDVRGLSDRHAPFAHGIKQIAQDLQDRFPKAINLQDGKLNFRPGMDVLARIVAAQADTTLHPDSVHSAAI